MKKEHALHRLLVVFFLMLFAAAGRAEAGIVNGYMELDYSTFDSLSRNGTDSTVHTKAHDWNQQYNLNMKLEPFPNVRINSGVTLGKDASDIRSEGSVDMKTSTTTVQPFIDVIFQDPFRAYSATVGYSAQENISRPGNSPRTITENETYHAMMGWRPLNLPSMDIRFTRTNQYDKERVSEDVTSDSLLLSSRYQPRKQFDLGYDAGYADSRDRVGQFETKTLNQSGRIFFSDSYLQQRMAVSTAYTISMRRTETLTQGGGEVSFPLFPIAALSAVSDTPLTETIAANPALIDGNVANSAGLNIGASLALSGDTKLREAGLDFFAVTEVNNLLLSVDRQLPPEIAGSFSWDIYTSADNQSWTLLQTVTGAPFGPFLNRFTIDFQNIKTRYLKVVTRPLSPAVPGATNTNFQNIFVTELQANLQQPAAAIRGRNDQVSQMINLNVRTRIVDALNLYHDLSFNMVTASGTATSPSTRYTVSNGLSLTHRFDKVFSGSARTAWEDSHDLNGMQTDTYSYNAVLAAAPLETVRSSLVYGGQTMAHDGKTSNSNTVSLNAAAELYPGINVNSSGGLTDAVSESGVRSRTITFLSGAGLVPHRTLTLNVNYSENRSQSSGGDLLQGTSTATARWEAGAAYRPFEAAYLTASISRQSQAERAPIMLRNYGFNWSPFPDGTLQFRFIYNESYRSDTESREKEIGPGAAWRIVPRGTLDLSYLRVSNVSLTQTSEVNTFSASFRMSF